MLELKQIHKMTKGYYIYISGRNVGQIWQYSGNIYVNVHHAPASKIVEAIELFKQKK